ncbi:glycoside hydrolase family 2 protein, partial [Coprobacter sp.]
MKNIKYRELILIFLFITNASLVFSAHSQNVPEFSTAGFFQTKNSGRDVYSLNPVWAFYKGDIKDAYKKEYNDTNWRTVNLPDGIELLPIGASGCINYQGIVWYRKHLRFTDNSKGKRFYIHFEAIMGKSEIYFNGKLLKKHYSGYLPVSIDITNEIIWGKDNIIAVKADNSNDESYPPGKSQETLDFSYFGGIYRDCWLIVHNNIYISDPIIENIKGGGGLSVSYNNVSEKAADILLSLHIRNDSIRPFSGKAIFRIVNKQGYIITEQQVAFNIQKKDCTSVKKKISLDKPRLWSPESPYLYNLYIELQDRKGNIIDGYRQRIGIRSIEFKGKDGFWLNGKPYGKPLIGANRHQDFAVIGNALSNSLHWRDAYKLRSAGIKVIRNAHYPQDPAFMDACDEIGLFVIVNTPGWQFWNDGPVFKERVYNDIRNIVKRDRNHTCVWLWEPILNETWYPSDFAQNANDIIHEEYPHKYCYTACDNEARGSEYFPVLFTHPSVINNQWGIKKMNPEISYFTREWGDNVDDWNSQNSPSRVARNWGEAPMLVQAQHYASPSYSYTSYNTLCSTTAQHIGGCLWHSFDHQRGYHPDPFYGGIMDAFRQPKYSYYMFMSQREPEGENKIGTGAMVYIAHEMTPFSSKDVTVYSNCEKVILTFNENGKKYIYRKDNIKGGMPSPIITFENVYDFMKDKHMSMEEGRQNEVYLLAEGYINENLVA